jgi:hypothetical protein
MKIIFFTQREAQLLLKTVIMKIFNSRWPLTVIPEFSLAISKLIKVMVKILTIKPLFPQESLLREWEINRLI